jgi:hypothetical protein
MSLGANNIPKSVELLLYVGLFRAICWAIWKSRNKACFEEKCIQDPTSIVCYACMLMGYWARLYMGVDKEELVEGINTMLKIAAKLVSKKKKTDETKLLEDNHNNSNAS